MINYAYLIVYFSLLYAALQSITIITTNKQITKIKVIKKKHKTVLWLHLC